MPKFRQPNPRVKTYNAELRSCAFAAVGFSATMRCG